MAPHSLPLDEARRIVLDSVRPLPTEELALDTGLLGRVLAQDAIATGPVPAFDGSAMDGYAVRAGDLRAASAGHPVTLRLCGESRAGAPAGAGVQAGTAIAISTGAAIPPGADAVVRVEDTVADAPPRERPGADRRTVRVLAAPAPGENIRRAGEDVRPGATMISAGATIGPAQLGVLASLGAARASCSQRPRLSVLVTGDELLEPGAPMRPGGVRDTNSLTIPALAILAGAEVVSVARAPDRAAATREAIAAALDADVAVICGGVSVGAHDHVRPALAALGARERFWGLALKPGHPAWFGSAGATPVFGLPGNPVSAMVTFVLLVLPALRALTGTAPPPPRAGAVMDSDYEKPRGRAHALRVRLSQRADGWHAQPLPAQGSHVLSSMLGADALAIVPAEVTAVRAGERVAIEPLPRPQALGHAA